MSTKIKFEIEFPIHATPHMLYQYFGTPSGLSEWFADNVNIKDNVLIGYYCTIIDSNFHDLKYNNRNETDPDPQEVIIEENVFIGNNVTILKGVVIGKNSVVAAGSIVTKCFPANVVIGGNPAKIIKALD